MGAGEPTYLSTLRESRGQSWSFSSKPTLRQHADGLSRGGDVVMFDVQAFCFLIFQFTENTFVLLLKTKKSFSQGSCQTAGPHPKAWPWREPAPQRREGQPARPPCSVRKSHKLVMPRPEIPKENGQHLSTRRHLEKVQTPQSTQVASPGNTRTLRDASPRHNPISTEVKVCQLHRHSTKPFLKK